MNYFILIFTILVQLSFAQDNSFYYKNKQKIKLTPYKTNRHVDFYKDDKDIVLGVTNKIIIKVKNDTNLKQLTQEFGLRIEKELMLNIYLISINDKAKTLDISNQLNTRDDIVYAHPDFIKKRISR